MAFIEANLDAIGAVDSDGDRPHTSAALAVLLARGVVVALIACPPGSLQDLDTIGLYVACNDTFIYACADAEPMPLIDADDASEKAFWELWDLWRAHGGNGVVR